MSASKQVTQSAAPSGKVSAVTFLALAVAKVAALNIAAVPLLGLDHPDNVRRIAGGKRPLTVGSPWVNASLAPYVVAGSPDSLAWGHSLASLWDRGVRAGLVDGEAGPAGFRVATDAAVLAGKLSIRFGRRPNGSAYPIFAVPAMLTGRTERDTAPVEDASAVAALRAALPQ